MSSVAFKLKNQAAVTRALKGYTDGVRRGASVAVGKTAIHLLSGWRREITAQGAVDEGRFRASTHAAMPGEPHPETRRTLGPTEAAVADGVAYGARLEFGFHGADSLGRHYNQAARPMLRTAYQRSKAYLDRQAREVLK